MARSTTTQRGASRRSATSTAKGGSATRGAGSPSRTAATRSRASSSRTPSRTAVTRRTTRTRPAGPWVPVIVLAVVAVLGWSLYPAIRLEYQASRRMAGLEQQRTDLERRNAALRAQVAELKTPAGVEKAAREGLGYTKQGENAYIVMPSTSPTGTTRPKTTTTASVGSTSLLQTVLDAIFGVSHPSTSLEP